MPAFGTATDSSEAARRSSRCAIRGTLRSTRRPAPSLPPDPGGGLPLPGNLNRALLIGVVDRPPVVDDRGWGLTISIPTERDGGLHVERVDVTGDGRLAATAAALRTAQLVYVEGEVRRGPTGAAVVRVRSLIALEDPPPPAPPDGQAQGTHASPRPHARAGHPRVLLRGTPGERVVWVRSTHVGANKPATEVRGD